MLNSGASINLADNDNENALHYASDSWEDNRHVIRLLIEKGIDVNAQNGNGTTALQLACQERDYEIVEMLLNAGASINMTDKNYKNALHCALESEKDNGDVIKLLMRKAAEQMTSSSDNLAA